ncbi:MAG: hypothetical protein LBK82_15245, partial [Planctomycetaceae bacterium]|nr:hypothetical protein [Planctomycetaceae bacterium]
MKTKRLLSLFISIALLTTTIIILFVFLERKNIESVTSKMTSNRSSLLEKIEVQNTTDSKQILDLLHNQNDLTDKELQEWVHLSLQNSAQSLSNRFETELNGLVNLVNLFSITCATEKLNHEHRLRNSGSNTIFLIPIPQNSVYQEVGLRTTTRKKNEEYAEEEEENEHCVNPITTANQLPIPKSRGLVMIPSTIPDYSVSQQVASQQVVDKQDVKSEEKNESVLELICEEFSERLQDNPFIHFNSDAVTAVTIDSAKQQQQQFQNEPDKIIEDETAKQKLAKELAEKKQAEEEAAKQKVAKELAEKKQAEEEAAKQKLAKELAEKKQAEEEVAKQKVAKELVEKKQAEEEAAKQKLAKEFAEKKQAEEEAAKQKLAKELAEKKQAEDEFTKQKLAKELAEKKQAEEKTIEQPVVEEKRTEKETEKKVEKKADSETAQQKNSDTEINPLEHDERDFLKDWTFKTVRENNRIQAAWFCWEPNAFDKSDQQKGRFNARIYRNNKSAVELSDVVRPDISAYYVKPFQSGQTIISEPYQQNGNGLIVSISAPIRYRNKPHGVCGIDLKPNDWTQMLSQTLESNPVLKKNGKVYLISPDGIVTASNDQFVIGKTIPSNHDVVSVTSTFILTGKIWTVRLDVPKTDIEAAGSKFRTVYEKTVQTVTSANSSLNATIKSAETELADKQNVAKKQIQQQIFWTASVLFLAGFVVAWGITRTVRQCMEDRENLYRQIVETVPLPLFVVDTETSVLLKNKTAEQQKVQPSEEALKLLYQNNRAVSESFDGSLRYKIYTARLLNRHRQA